MATITSTPTAGSLTVSGTTQVSGTISWNNPSVPSNATISSCVLTGTATASMSKGNATITVNGQNVTSGSGFTIDLGTSNSTTSVATTAKGGNKNASGTVSFSNLVYTVTYTVVTPVSKITLPSEVTLYARYYNGSWATIDLKQQINIEPAEAAADAQITWKSTNSSVQITDGVVLCGSFNDGNPLTSTITASITNKDNSVITSNNCTVTSKFVYVSLQGFYLNGEFVSSFNQQNSMVAGIEYDVMYTFYPSDFPGEQSCKITIKNNSTSEEQEFTNGKLIFPSAGEYNVSCSAVANENRVQTMTITVTAAPIMYTVTFVDWDGTVLKTESVLEGSSVTPPNNPSRAGYEFIGWDKDFSNITTNLTIIAQYQIINNVNNIYYGDIISGNLYLGDEGVIRIYIGDTLIYGIPK